MTPHVPADEQVLRSELRSWLSGKLPFPELPEDGSARADMLRRWQRALFDGGWAGVSLPPEYGGRGLTPVDDAIVGDELGAAGAPSPFAATYAARVLLEYGSAAHRRRRVRPALRGDERWCQGFAEPGAPGARGVRGGPGGSGVLGEPPGVATTAVRDGRSWVLTGRKLPAAWAGEADWCLVLARATGRRWSGGQGLACFAVPLDARRVAVRSPSGESSQAEAEVTLDGARVPDDALVGPLGHGREVAEAALAHERGPADAGRIAEMRLRLARLVAQVVMLDLPPKHTLSCTLAGLHASVEVLGRQALHVLREAQAPAGRQAGPGGGPASPLDELVVARTQRALASLEADVGALVGPAPRPARRPADWWPADASGPGDTEDHSEAEVPQVAYLRPT